MKFHICLYKNDLEVLNINNVTSINWFGNFIQILTDFDLDLPFGGFIFTFDEFDYFKVDKIND